MGNTSTYNVEILNSFNPELQLEDTESAVKSKLIDLSIQLKGFAFVTTLALVFKKIESKDKKNIEIFIQVQKRNNYQWKWHWWCASINLYYNYHKHTKFDQTVSISKDNSLVGSRYIKLPKELDYPKIGLINI